MGGIEYYIEAFRRYADFEGRSRRSEYWYFVLFNIITSLLIIFSLGSLIKGGAILIYLLYLLISFIPNLSLIVRRLHDTNRSGAHVLLAFIPLVGSIIMLVFMTEEGTHGPNKYGPDPKEEDEEETFI